MNDKGNIKAAVIGAGLTGLTTAFYLKRAGVDFQVFEKADRAGGVIQTYHEKGFTFEAGPNSGVLSRPEVAELFEDLGDACTPEPADETAKARWIWKKDRWVPLPSGVMSGITTPLFSWPDKLKLLSEPFLKKGNNPDETLRELVLRRMGRSFLDYAIDPFILGIYSGDPAKLVTRYAFPKLYHLEQDYGSFIGGALKKAREPKTDRDKKATKSIFSVKGGLHNLIDALVTRIGRENITFGAKDLKIAKTAGGFTLNLSDEKFTHVITTVGGYALEDVLSFIGKGDLGIIPAMNYSRVVQVALGFSKWEGLPLNAFGGLVPSVEQRRILGALFLSSFLKNKAPENGALLSVFLGGVRRPEMIDYSDEQITEIVREELVEMFRLPSFNPDLIKIFRYPHAIPQYGPESEQKINTIARLEKAHPGLILAGNIRDGIGIADRVNQGRQVATEIVNSVK